jgi:hypothetical protein
MALMEWRCKHQAFKRGVQPAITNSPTHLLTKQKPTDRKKGYCIIDNLVYRGNCYDTFCWVTANSQIAAIIPTTTTAITSIMEAYITNKNIDKDAILLRILFRFHMLCC